MKRQHKVALGMLAGAGAIWGARQWLRSRRRIDLDDKVVIVTGATSGHGLIVARQAAERGAWLVLAARDPEELRRATEDLQAHGSRDVLAVPTDVSDLEQAERLVEVTLERHGRVDILVNNAGIITVGPLEMMTVEDFQQVMATNFWGALHCTLAVLPHMKARQFGRIANVGSVGGKVAIPHLLPYTASKFALAGLTKGLRAELAQDNVLVTGIYPATMRTGGHTHALYKGRRQEEYTWFALGDSLPLLSISAESVASRLWDAVCHGDPEANCGWQSQIAPVFESLFPGWTAEALALINAYLMPGRTGGHARGVRGEDLRGSLPDLLNRAVPGTARPSTGNGRG